MIATPTWLISSWSVPRSCSPAREMQGVMMVDKIAVIRHRGWLWKGSQMREGQACVTGHKYMHKTMAGPSAHLSSSESHAQTSVT